MKTTNNKYGWVKYTAGIILLLLMVSPAFSQSNVAFGGKVGFTQSDLYGKDVNDVQFRNSVAAGAFLKISPVSFFAIQPEFLFTKKGAVHERNAGAIKDEYRINYFEIPVLAKLRLPIAGIVYPNVFAGPYYAFTTGATYTVVQNETDITAERDIDVKRSDYGGIVGAGVDVELSVLMLSIDARYGMGAAEIEDVEGSFDIKNRNWNVMAGVGIILGK
jgi:hypothetical protein